MPVQKKQTKTTRKRYSPEFGTEALCLAWQAGVAGVSSRLGLNKS